MLILKFRRGEHALIGSDIKVVVLDIDARGQVKLGFEAPKDINVLRGTLAEKIEADGGKVYTRKENEA